jgi:sirohydrochlorin ferrochelatase
MAAAGISEWRIQVFGRWGSDAVLRYIRDASIDAASHNLSGEIEEALAVTVHHIARSSDTPQYPDHVKGLALEALGNDAEVQESEVGHLAAEFARHCSDVQAQLRSLEAKSRPTIVLCRASKRAHRVANALSTLCGWSWNSDPRAALLVQSDWDGAWCKRCSVYADCLVGGA